MSSDYSQAAFDKDPANRLYWRANRHRLDAEQIRDSVLFVSGALDSKMGGPSADLTPGYKRRTVYGKVSRYRLDEYLQLFDFPSPSFSAEKRHITTVPLQRLFFMNSDFMQQQAELLARSTESEPDRDGRIRKLYQAVFGRACDEAELRAGVEFLKSEPMRSYEERKAEPPKKEPAPEPAGERGGPADEMKVDGMMAGVAGVSPRKPENKPVPVTAWGRYAKVLLSSPEFLYVE